MNIHVHTFYIRLIGIWKIEPLLNSVPAIGGVKNSHYRSMWSNQSWYVCVCVCANGQLKTIEHCPIVINNSFFDHSISYIRLMELHYWLHSDLILVNCMWMKMEGKKDCIRVVAIYRICNWHARGCFYFGCWTYCYRLKCVNAIALKRRHPISSGFLSRCLSRSLSLLFSFYPTRSIYIINPIHNSLHSVATHFELSGSQINFYFFVCCSRQTCAFLLFNFVFGCSVCLFICLFSVGMHSMNMTRIAHNPIWVHARAAIEITVQVLYPMIIKSLPSWFTNRRTYIVKCNGI